MKRSAFNQLAQWHTKPQRKPLIILGARQVGKTYLVKEFGQTKFPNCHVFNFELETNLIRLFDENLDPLRILKELSFIRGQPIHMDRDLVFFDEIQAAPRALTSLKHFREKVPQLAICAAGSLLGLQLAEASFPVGNVDFLQIGPMSLEEFVTARAPEHVSQVFTAALQGESLPISAHDILWRYWREYLVTGGLPEVVANFINHDPDTLLAFEVVRDTQQKTITSYLADIAKHSGKTNAMQIGRILQSVPMQLAAAQDLSASKFKFKGVIPGVHTYGRLANAIDWLNNAGLLIKVPICNRAEIPPSAFTQENRFKLYLFDVGLLGTMLNLPPASLMQYSFGSYKGYIAENYVAQELKASSPTSPIFGWEEGGAEIEFLIQGSTSVIPIEVKSQTRIRAKSLKVFRQKYHPPKSVIISGRPSQRQIDPVDEAELVNIPLYLTPQVWSIDR